MIVKLIPLLLIITLKTSRSSLVIDNISQKGVYLTDYCPAMKYCREATHVMCMYYDVKRSFGPRCSNPLNISMNAQRASELLDIANAIRSKVANGKEAGKDGKLLPRGYGIFRLKWDNELATFAQVLANQCMLRHDMCRATKRFMDPTQSVGLVRFTYPDWKIFARPQLYPRPGMTDEKLSYAITQAMKSWYADKAFVTDNMVKTYPDWTTTPTHATKGRLYLNMIFGPNTHMGCGMSAYSEYAFFENDRQGVWNSIQVICNFALRAYKGDPSYQIEFPIPGLGYSPRCGCPPGSIEDSDCLCNLHTPPAVRTPPAPTCSNGDMSGNCEPALVLLPIFTIEDAPPAKLYQQVEEIRDPLKNFLLESIDNSSTTFQKPMDFFDIFDNKDKENQFWHPTPVPHSLRTVLAQPQNAQLANSHASHRALAPVPPPVFPPSLPSRQHPPPRPPVPPHSSSFARPIPPPHAASPALPLPPPRIPHLRPNRPAPLPPTSPSLLPPAPPPRVPPPRLPPPPPPNIGHDYMTALSSVLRKPPKLPPKFRPVAKKSNIFTRVVQFKLPGRKNIPPSYEIIKKDVTPRKDFSNLSQVVKDYLKNRNKNKEQDENPPQEEENPESERTTHKEEPVTETSLKKAEERVINFNQYIKQQNHSNDKDIDIKDDNDNKLMTLLDNLEREVKNISIDGNVKDIFDIKIRKIYGTLVGNTTNLTSQKLTNPNDLDGAEIDIGDTKSNVKFEKEEKVLEELTTPKPTEVENKNGPEMNYDDLIHKRKDTISERFDAKKYDDFKLNDKYMDDLDRKFNENLDRKYSENHLDHKYHHHLDHKYDDHISGPRSLMKYEPGKDLVDFRDFKHGHIDRNSYRDKDSEKLYRIGKRIKNRHSHGDLDDPLSIERRKYYQEKLDNIERKLRMSRNNRRKGGSRNDRPMRRMRLHRDGVTRPKSSKSDHFYMPDRARFLHGF